MEAGAELGAEPAAEEGIHAFSDEDAWDLLEEIPNDSAAVLLLIEHHWAVPLRDAVARAGGFRLADGFISPLDLVEIGLVTAEEAAELHAQDKRDVMQETPGARGPTSDRGPARRGGSEP
jgi:sugar phosphate isomerase/epimerase